jgi:hypothetical protein
LQKSEKRNEEEMTDVYEVEGFETEIVQEVFEYLDSLRESGATNMFGATPYLQTTFELEQREARKLLARWMETFNARVVCSNGLILGYDGEDA